MNNFGNRLKAALPLILGLALSSAVYAQGPLSSAAAGATQEMVALIRWIAIIVVMVCGIGIAVSHQHGFMGRAAAAIVGLFIALDAQQVASWIQAL